MADDTDVLVPQIHEDQLPGSEAKLEPKPEWQPRYKGSGRLQDKVAIITGADSGIGRAVAALFAREGADVAILYLCEHEDAEKTREIVEGEGRRAITIAGDIGSKEFCEQAVQQTIDAFGRLDILVNNAGEQHPDKDVRDITEEQLRRTFQTNIFGMFFMTQAARPHLKKGAAIINCTSVTMYKGSPDLLDYSSTKGAITAFTRSLAKNLVKDGIRVNAVAPGPIWTPLNPFGGQPPEDVKDFGKDSPMGRPGQPNEVAPSFLFLACDDASYMTGQVLHPDGGESTSS
ncbi:SDR family oxidoreductase [Sphingomonas sp. RG327]|jgi:NAD(P)-dependent dehydrogenase (short-subunit alcohol dehydrogenase family)|uniref:SDR family oxidoreductase n=1 Tax=Sphingomonas anseongensis TaxID=2908207 RepID=A0ABT0RGR4_9SPHN|nr:SDR family oxidoreductase [Sphingomonas anseongensis]MCL6679462.1 SDR family oxidoreductase [Sphingomonas anseongensis]